MADLQRKSYNLFDVSGQRTSTYAGISIVDDTIYISRIYGGAASYLIYAYTYSAGTYTISLDYTGDLTKVRFLSTTSFEGGTYNSYYNAYYKDFDSSKTMTLTFDSDFGIGFAFDGTNGGTGIVSDIMMNTGNQPKPYEPYGWVHSLRKLTTATEAVENPLYTDGTAITAYNIKGNEEHTGTPSPSNPITINGVGNKTANLLDFEALKTAGSGVINSVTFPNLLELTLKPNTSYTCVSDGTGSESGEATDNRSIYFNNTTSASAVFANHSYSSTTDAQGKIKIGFFSDRNNASQYLNGTAHVWIVEGSTAKPYEPWGYKIPISSGQQTTNIFLGSTQTTRQIKKLVLDGTETLETQVQSPLFLINIPTNHFIPRVTALCTEYNYNPVQSSILANSQHGDFGLQYVGVRDEYNIWFNNSTIATRTDFSAYLAQQYANGTPVTVWYVLQTATTATVNEPLMKIGDYADTLSNATAIPTTEGANPITVDTTVQPSEFSATWTGWHDASVKEKSENLFDTFDIVGQVPSISNGQLINYNGSTTSLIPIISGNITVTKPPTALLYLLLYAADMSYIGYVQNSTDANFYGSSVTGYENAKYCRLRIDRTTGLDDIQIMLNTGSTALPYEPYWK